MRSLYKRLVDDGVDAWLDQEKLLPGQNWREEIPKAVRASDVFLVCLTNHSINKEGYVQREIREALDVAEEKPEGTIFIIPARLEECNVPVGLKTYQWVDLFAEDGYQRLLRALARRAEKIGVEAPSPPKEDTQKTKPRRAKENGRRVVAALALAALCACLAISFLATPLLAPYLRTPTPSPTLPPATPTSQPITSTPTLMPTETPLPEATATSLIGRTTEGPWSSQVGGLVLSVDQVEVIDQIGDKKILKFYFSIDNRTNNSIMLPLRSFFQAIDDDGHSYRHDDQHSEWPDFFSPLSVQKGTIDLIDPVPNTVSLMKVTFSYIFGGHEFLNKSITVSDIEVP